MTNDKLNRWIAEKRGWWQVTNTKVWMNQTVQVPLVHVPDYCTDWKLAGELLEEANITLISVEGGTEERVGWIATAEYPVIFSTFKNGLWYEASTEHFCFADTPQRAIAEAYKAWKENV